jgi:hypothetical protein
MEECDNTYGIPSQYCFFNIEELKQHTERHRLHPQLNESNANLLESLMTMTTMCGCPHNVDNNKTAST